jgi:cbb3-type cytochrome oxidase subunit 3
MFFAWFGLFDLLFFIGMVWFLVWARRKAATA